MRPLCSALFLLTVNGFVPTANAQSELQFEVATIKESSEEGPFTMGLHPGGRFIASHITLRLLLQVAYQTESQDVVGAPSWWDSRKFDVQAQAPSNATGREQVQLMLRGLLKERMALAAHFEVRPGQGYVLTMVGDKTNLKPPSSVPPLLKPGAYKIEGANIPLSELAKALTRMLGRTVRDETGILGSFDFTLEWSPPDNEGRELSVFTAIQEQLGLRLRAVQLDRNVLVIDHVGSTIAPN